MPNTHSEQVRRGKKLRLWRLLLPVWTTSIFIAFENAIMSVISTDYTTFFFFLLSVSTDTEWWNYSWCHGMSSFYALSKQNEIKKKKFLLLAAHLHGAPRWQSGLYHLHAGFWVAEIMRTTPGPQNAFGIISLISQERKAKIDSQKHPKYPEGLPWTKRSPKDSKSRQACSSWYPWKRSSSWNAERRGNL